jgi:hypothetical protein
MPLGRYFLFATSLLLALLFLANRYMPEVPAESLRAEVDRSIIRIHSGHKWPDAVVFDTSIPTITPPQAVASNDPVAKPPRNTFAQMATAPSLPRPGAAIADSAHVSSKRPVRSGRPAVRRLAGYQANDWRTVPATW